MSDQPFIFTPEQEAWLVDLETTEEPQAMGDLHRFSGSPGAGYCCLGRACVVLGIKETRSGDLGFFDGNTALLPDVAVEKLRLLSDGGRLKLPVADGVRSHICLTAMNDAGWTFKQIAAYIRANPRDVFTEPAHVD